MTLLHQAAQKAVEALTHVTTSETFFRDPRGDLAGPAIDALESALQQQPEPVATEEAAYQRGKRAGYIDGYRAAHADERQQPDISPALQQQEVPREPPESELVCYEAYAALGMFLMELAEGEHPQAEKLLDNLSQARLAHKDVLPFSPSTTQQQEAGSPQWPNDPEGLSAIDRVAFSTAIRALLATAHDLSRNQGLRESCAKLADHLRRMTATASPTPESAEKDDAGGGKEQ